MKHPIQKKMIVWNFSCYYVYVDIFLDWKINNCVDQSGSGRGKHPIIDTLKTSAKKYCLWIFFAILNEDNNKK